MKRIFSILLSFLLLMAVAVGYFINKYKILALLMLYWHLIRKNDRYRTEHLGAAGLSVGITFFSLPINNFSSDLARQFGQF
jgi:hypothetical protein